jgi:hypothetical protein
MNPSTYQGFGSGVSESGSITRFQQTGPFFSSFNFTLPPGIKRFEAMLIGGGGGAYADYTDQYGNGNGYASGGGFGGLGIFRIPIYLDEYTLTVGAGGVQGNGGTTSIQIASVVLARMGGGGVGTRSENAGDGRYGGHGGGGGRFDWAWGGSAIGLGGHGGEIPQGDLIWSLNHDNTPVAKARDTGSNSTAWLPTPYDVGTREGGGGGRGFYGAGNAGADGNTNNAYRSGGSWSYASYGGGSRYYNNGYGTNTVVWGFRLPDGNNISMYGAYGIFGANSGVNGGLGGGGAGYGGNGGVGAAVFRYYF